MSVLWVNEKMKIIWKEQCVSIGNYLFFWRDCLNSQNPVT